MMKHSLIVESNNLELNSRGIMINGAPFFPLCASLFYFRIPPELWEDRIKKVKAAGYNTIDVYFPWNYHEENEGRFDFDGWRDVARFLDVAKQYGLYVIARPGPYICSEWDGGGLPAWLFVKEKVRLRQNDPLFLQYVERWYSRIISIIRERQVTKGGPVILLQIENELDFFSCEDRPGYLSALLKMVRRMGITIPVTACIGMGDLYGATGGLDEILPTVNLYPEDRQPGVEEGLQGLVEEFAGKNLPVVVTETGRSHLLLRRLLSAGVKGLAPFLQVSGTNFGFWNSVNDWKEPVAFLASDNDFGGMIDPAGRLRPEYYEARLLAGFITSFTSELAWAKPAPDGHIKCTSPWLGAPDTEGSRKVRSLLGPNGVFFIFPANLSGSDRETRLILGEETIPKHSGYIVKNDCVPILVSGLSLDKWGIPAVLSYTTSEICYLGLIGGDTVMILYGEESAPGEIAFGGDTGIKSEILVGSREKISVFREDEKLIITYFHDKENLLVLQVGDRRLLIVVTTRYRAGRSWILQEEGINKGVLFGPDWVEPSGKGFKIRIKAGERMTFLDPSLLKLGEGGANGQAGIINGKPVAGPILSELSVESKLPLVESYQATIRVTEVLPGDSPEAAGAVKKAGWTGPLEHMERFGLRKGFAWYLTSGQAFDTKKRNPQNNGRAYLYFGSGADVVSVYSDGEYLDTVIPCGESLLLPLHYSKKPELKVAARVEIWGHSNFDHKRVPALALGSLRGLNGVGALVYEAAGVWLKVKTDGGERKKSTWIWRPTIPIEEETVVIRLNKEPTSQVTIHLNGVNLGEFRRHKRITRIPPYLIRESNIFEFNMESSEPESGNTACSEELFRETDEPVTILSGSSFTDWEIWGLTHEELARWVGSNEQAGNLNLPRIKPFPITSDLNYPIRIQPGRIAKVQLKIGPLNLKPGSTVYLIFKGHGCKLTVCSGNKILGRLWLPSSNKPEFAGGAICDRLYFPESWIKKDTVRIGIFAEAISAGEPGEITSVRYEVTHPEPLQEISFQDFQ